MRAQQRQKGSSRRLESVGVWIKLAARCGKLESQVAAYGVPIHTGNLALLTSGAIVPCVSSKESGMYGRKYGCMKASFMINLL
jgi:hypothetical protein